MTAGMDLDGEPAPKCAFGCLASVSNSPQMMNLIDSCERAAAALTEGLQVEEVPSAFTSLFFVHARIAVSPRASSVLMGMRFV